MQSEPKLGLGQGLGLVVEVAELAIEEAEAEGDSMLQYLEGRNSMAL